MTDANATEDYGIEPLEEEQTEQIATEPEETTESETTEEAEATEEPSPSVDEKPDPVQARINAITAEKYKEKRRADALEAELAEAKGAKTAPSTDAPTLEDFDYDDTKFNEAVIQHHVRKQLAEQVLVTQQAEAEAARMVVESKFATKQAEFAAKTADYDEVINQVPILQPETLGAVMSLDNGPEMAYYLGKHLDVADEIASATPVVAAIRLG